MKSYFIFLSRNKLYTAIQFFGLAISLAVVLLLISYARTEFSIGAASASSHRLYAVGKGSELGMTVQTAPALLPAIPEITEWTRLSRIEPKDVTVDDSYYQVQCMAVDSNFFCMLNYPLVGCDPATALLTTHEVVLSESFARKAFGSADPIGSVVMYLDKIPLRVVGILPTTGSAELLKPVDMLISFQHTDKEYGTLEDFSSAQIFVSLADGTSVEEVRIKLLQQYKSRWDYWEEDGQHSSSWGASLVRMDEIYFSPLNNYTPFRSGDKQQVQILFSIAFILLLSAVVNYINLSVSQTGKRAHEMATRRLLGDTAAQIIVRYLTESAIFTTACFIVACFVALGVKPHFERLLSTTISMSPSLPNLLLMLLLLIAISVISGLFPALMIHKYSPIDIVKGRFRLQSKQLFSHLFIIVQNIISTVLVALGLTMSVQMHHLSTLPTGYRTDLAFVFTSPLGQSYQKQLILQKRLSSLPMVTEVAMATYLPFVCVYLGLEQPGEENTSWLNFSEMDSTAFRMMGFQVVEQWSDPLPGKVWVTEETCRRYSLSADNPSWGKADDASDLLYTACGVIRDYRLHHVLESPLDDSHGVVSVLNPRSYCNKLLVSTQGNREEALQVIREACREVCDEVIGMPKELDVYYVDDFMNIFLAREKNAVLLVLGFMLISVLISAFGLLAMSISYTEQQSKRMALCKVMGAGTMEVVWELSKRFMMLSLLAACFAFPISLKVVQISLEPFYNRIAFPWYLLIAAVVSTVVISFLAIIGQTLKVALRNPIESIRTE